MHSIELLWNEIENQTAHYKSAKQSSGHDLITKIILTANSTKIEGCSLNIAEVSDLIKNGVYAKDKPLYDHYMALDHHSALDLVLSHAQQKKLLTLEFIQSVGARVMKRTGKEINSALGTTKESGGDFRKVNVSSGTHFFINYDKVEKRIRNLIQTVNYQLNKVTGPKQINSLAFLTHFDFVSIHPFTDGNGRVGRLLMNYIQAYHNEPLTIVFADHKTSYIDALNKSRAEETSSPIQEFLALEHLRLLKKKLS